MVVYEFYRSDPVKGEELLGVLPERRNDPSRITRESVMGWAVKVFGQSVSIKDIYFIPVKINTYTGNNLGPIRSSLPVEN